MPWYERQDADGGHREGLKYQQTIKFGYIKYPLHAFSNAYFVFKQYLRGIRQLEVPDFWSSKAAFPRGCGFSTRLLNLVKWRQKLEVSSI